MKYIIAGFSLFLISNGIFAQEIINAVALENGSEWLSLPKSKVDNSERSNFQNYSPDALIDLTDKKWCSKDYASFPFVFEIQFSEEFSLSKIEFDNRVETGTGAKQVVAEFALSGKGYGDKQSFDLAENKNNAFSLDNIQARKIRLTILSNFGSAANTQLNELKVFGMPRHKTIEQIDIAGLWETNWQLITYKQSGATFSATYSYDKKNAGSVAGTVYDGRIERNKMSFKWKEGQLMGSAVLYLNEEGNLLSGKWWNDRRSDDFGLWIMKRKESKPIRKKMVENDIQFNDETVSLGKKIILKNVLFVQSKPELLTGSEKDLDKLISVLKSNPNLKVEINGHTDNIGNEELNVQLSEERVTTVKNYLIKNGISAQRISGKGFGGKSPIADNNNEETRKLNRRVEFILY